MQASFPLLMAWLHKRRKLTPAMLSEPEAVKFIEQMTAGFNTAVDKSIRQVPLDAISLRRLRESNYIFSGIKTFHELNEAFPSLLDEDGNIKPFERFLNDVQSINDTYNGSYLRTEYNFARNSALMAAKWKEFEASGDRYHLQYRTAGDERVRASHAKLQGITLPISSRFWDSYMPPNGYGCRCDVVQVRKGKYPLSDEREALNLASQATAGKHQEMMRFNPGKEMTTFPAYNAYTRSRCKNCDNRPGNIKLAADIPDNELCAACRFLHECYVKRETVEKIGKGQIRINKLVNPNDSDYGKLYNIAKFFAKDGADVYLAPKMGRPPKFVHECIFSDVEYEKKCPDLKINGIWYEHEGYTSDDPKNALRNMFNHGLKQCSRLILDQPELTDAYIKRNIHERIKFGQNITEVWLRNGDNIRLLYKKSEE